MWPRQPRFKSWIGHHFALLADSSQMHSGVQTLSLQTTQTHTPSIAQLVEHLTVDQMVPGSIPGRRTFIQCPRRLRHAFVYITLRVASACPASSAMAVASTPLPGLASVWHFDRCGSDSRELSLFCCRPVCRRASLSPSSWCSGYHICLTHRRSPVQSRAMIIAFRLFEHARHASRMRFPMVPSFQL